MSKKVNPYEKKTTKRRHITKKQRNTAIVVLCVAAIVAGIIVAAKLSGASAADPHAGHNHAAGEEHTEDDGHDHSSTTTTHPSNSSHNGNYTDNPSGIDTGVLNYRVYTNGDKTFRIAVVDKDNKTLFQKDKLFNIPVAEKVDGSVFVISWATGDGPNDFESIFCNKDTGAVSALFYAPRGYDAKHVAYSSDDQTAIIVQDIFNKSAYLKRYVLKGAYTEGAYTIRNGIMKEDKIVQVTYVVNKNYSIHTVSIPLYE